MANVSWSCSKLCFLRLSVHLYCSASGWVIKDFIILDTLSVSLDDESVCRYRTYKWVKKVSK